MAEVPGAPYEPYFTAQPTERPIQLRGVDAPAAAFGENIAHAVSIFGGDVEKAGNEVWSRAFNLRKLQVEGELRDLTTAYYNEAAPVQDDFLIQQGNNASPAAMNEHIAKLEVIRQKYSGMASKYGPYGVNLFGNEAASMQRNFIRSATAHSANETRHAHDQSIDAKIGAVVDQMRTADSDKAYNKAKDTLKGLELERQGIWGQDKSVTDFKTFNTISKAAANRAKGQILRNPGDAPKIEEAARNSGELNGQDQDEVLRAAQVATPTAVSQWFRQTYAGQNTRLGDAKVNPDRLVDAIYEMEGHSRGPEITKPGSKYYGERALPGGVMPGNLTEWLAEAGMPKMTEAEYEADPKAQRQLMRFKLDQYQEKYGSANRAALAWFEGPGRADLDASDKMPGYRGTTGAGYLQGFNKALARNASQKEIGDAAEAYGDSLATTSFPDLGERYREHAVAKIDSERARDRAVRFDIRNQINENIIAKNYKDWDEFAADPANRQLIEDGMKVDSTFIRSLATAIPSNYRARQVHTNYQHLQDLYVMYDENHDKFMEVNPWEDKQLSFADRVKIAKLQGDLHRTGTSDPNFSRAFNDLAAMYPNEVPKKADDPEGYAAYKGDLYIAMQAWQEKNKAPLKLGTTEGTKAIEDIHQMLMTKSGGGWFSSGRELFRQTDIPDEFYNAAKRTDPTVTDDQIRYEYIKAQSLKHFSDLYAAKAKGRPFIGGGFPHDATPPERSILSTVEDFLHRKAEEASKRRDTIKPLESLSKEVVVP